MSGPNWIKFGTSTKWGMLSPNVVIKLVCDVPSNSYIYLQVERVSHTQKVIVQNE